MAKIKTTSVREKEQEDEQLFMLGKTGGDDDDDVDDDGEEEDEGGDQQEASHAQLLSDMMKLAKSRKVQQEVRTSLSTAKADTSHLLKRLMPNTNLRKDNRSHTLPLPMEKTVARRIKRAAGYENVAMEVNKWAKVVKMRREAEQLHYPLVNNDLSIKTVEKTDVQMRTPLEQEVYSLLQGAKLVQEKKETEEERVARKALSLQEIKERNRELWRQKEMKRRYEQKARLMNKSKSRKHHRLLRRERLRKQRAELEELQKTDPEAALERLEELERARIEERMSLRHKTSKWAHLQGFRATRDKNAMSALRENQRMHQELTSKTAKPENTEEEDSVNNASASDEEGDGTVGGAAESSNPWTRHLQGSAASKPLCEDESFTRFKRFWEEVNRRKQEDKEIEEQLEKEREEKKVKEEDGSDEEEKDQQEQVEEEEKMLEQQYSIKEEGEQTHEEEKKVSKKQKGKKKKAKGNIENLELEKMDSEGTGKKSKKKKTKKLVKSMESTEQEAVNIDDLFDEVEIGIKNKVKRKLKKLGVKSNEPWTKVQAKKKHKKATKTAIPLEIEEFDFTSTCNRENIDEKLERAKTIQDLESIEGESKDTLQDAAKILKASAAATDRAAPKKPKLQVDPTKFLQVEAKRLVTAMPDSVGEAGEAMDDEEEKEESAEAIIREAFADDYLMEEFSSEKAEAIKKDQPGSMSLALPGWGDWTGPSIKMSNKKIKKFRLRVSHAPRKDSRIGHVLYNESADVHTNLRKSMVTELPYPFKSVKDFEASVRAPVGRLFVPEAAHKKMIAPPVVTKMGTVIQPMTEDELLLHETPVKNRAKASNKQSEPSRGRKRQTASGNPRQQNAKKKVWRGEKKVSR